jgi:hypothetical protein
MFISEDRLSGKLVTTFLSGLGLNGNTSSEELVCGIICKLRSRLEPTFFLGQEPTGHPWLAAV